MSAHIEFLVAYPYAIADVSMDRARALFEVNFFGPLATVKTFLPLLLLSSQARIVNIGSVSAVMPVPFGGIYNASKAALHSLGDTLRVELAPFKCVSLHRCGCIYKV